MSSFDYFAALPAETKHALTISEVEELISQFKRFDKGSGSVSSKEIVSLSDALGSKYGDTKAFLDGFGSHKGQDTLSFSDFAKVYHSVHSNKKVMKVKGQHDDTVHTISEEEKRGYVTYINTSLKEDSGLKGVIPVDPNTMDIFSKVADGNILGKLINKGFPGTVELNNLTAPNPWQKLENCQKVIAGSQKIGCQTVNIAAEDLTKGTPHLILGLIWQVIKKNLLAEVARLLPSGGDDLPPEQLLFRWFNSHLARAGSERMVNNWSSDLVDSENFITLLAQIAPESITAADKSKALALSDKLERANMVMEFANRVGCGSFVSPKEIVAGNPRLNLAFVAQLFQKYPNMGPSVFDITKSKNMELEKSLSDSIEQQRQEREKRESMELEIKRITAEKEGKDRELSEVNEKLRIAREERDREAKRREEMQKEIDRIESELKRINEELAKNVEENKELKEHLSREKAEREKLRRELDELKNLMEQERRENQEKISKFENTIAELQKSLSNEREEREKLLRLLEQRNQEFEKMKKDLNEQISSLSTELSSERALRQKLEQDLATKTKEYEEMHAKLTAELANERQLRKQDQEAFEKEKQNLLSQLENEKQLRAQERQAFEKEKSELLAQLENERKLRAQEKQAFEKEKHDLLAIIEQLKQRIKELEEELLKTKVLLEEERKRVSDLKDELKDITELLEETRVESDEEKTLLLQRIKDLEEEYETLQKASNSSLSAAERARAEEMAKAKREKDAALQEAERQRILQMNKVKGLLSKVQRQGFLYHKEKGKLGGTSWKKRYFVLQDHFLSFYRDQKAFARTEPMGLISCEQCRVYEQNPDGKKADMFPFQLDTGDKQVNLAATKSDEMKLWMKDIKEAKKKAVGVKVVSEDKASGGSAS